jgi:hypothetical protein
LFTPALSQYLASGVALVTDFLLYVGALRPVLAFVDKNIRDHIKDFLSVAFATLLDVFALVEDHRDYFLFVEGHNYSVV